MRAAGILQFSTMVQSLALPNADALRPDEVLIDVRCAGVGNWDDAARTGKWNLGQPPPLALGVEASGVIIAIGTEVTDLAINDQVMTHSLPLRNQGTWAQQHVAPQTDVAKMPASVSFEEAAAMPIPALTATQTLRDTLDVTAGSTLLVNGASGMTGTMLVQLAAHLGATVTAVAGPTSADRIAAAGASHVVDYHSPRWPNEVRALTGGAGADHAVNAVPGGAAQTLAAVRDGGKLATITSDVPAAERHITVSAVYVLPDGPRLAALGEMLAAGVISVEVGAIYPLEDAATALAHAKRGAGGRAVLLQPSLHSI